jgi:hypothetical protein
LALSNPRDGRHMFIPKVAFLRHIFVASCFFFVACETATTPAVAQNLLQMMIQEAQRQEAIKQQQQAIEAQIAAEKAAENARIAAIKQTWTALDANVYVCVNKSLQAQGQSIDILIKQGVEASNPGLADVINNRCSAIAAQKLLKRIPCQVDGEKSICNEEYVFTNNPTVSATADQLATALLGGRSNMIGVAQIEVPEERTKRVAAAQKRAAAAEAKKKSEYAEQLILRISPLIEISNQQIAKQAQALRKTLQNAKNSPKTTNDQLVLWDAEVKKLLDAERDEKIRLEKVKAEKLARGEVDIQDIVKDQKGGIGTGSTARIAKTNAYFDIFLRPLRDQIGDQANGDVGKAFRKNADADIDKFKAQYFTSDTIETCKQSNGSFKCEVTRGTFKLGALNTDIKKMMSATVGNDKHDFRFILRYRNTDDEVTKTLIAQISAAFINYGYKIVSKSGEDEAEAQGLVDFYLNILDIKYIESLDNSSKNITYVLSAQLKLLQFNKDPTKRQDLANVPVSNTKQTLRNTSVPLASIKTELLQAQGKELAGMILQNVNERLLTLAKAQTQSVAAVAGSVKAPTQYSIRIVGLSQRERDRIRALREAIKKALKDTPVQVDPDRSDEKAVELTFDQKDKFDPEDLIDVIYDVFKDKKSFKIKYMGNNTFEGQV